MDYLVEMARFDTETQLDRLAERSALDLELMPQLADAIVQLHELAEWRFDHGGRNGMAAVIRGNRDGLRSHGPDALDRTACDRVTADSFDMLGRHTDLLEARRKVGFVRHCHGDLHLRNVCLVDGAPTLFDSVEFNPAIACVDVMYDVAFLLMDLLHRGLARYANAVLNRYVVRTGDLWGLALLPVFLSVRAAVRAKTSATAIAMQTEADEAARLGMEAREYLVLAQELLAPRAPRLVAVGGPSGSGKTTLARLLAPCVGPAPGAIVLRSDLERKRLLGVSPQTRLGADGYSAAVTRNVYRKLAEVAEAILSSGHGVIVDAVCADPLDRATLIDVARTTRTPFTGLWLEASLETLAARLSERRHDASDATPGVAARQIARMVAPESWVTLDASCDVDRVYRSARRAMDQAREH